MRERFQVRDRRRSDGAVSSRLYESHHENDYREENLLHPRDPEASFCACINCECMSMEVVPEFDEALDRALVATREEP